MLLAYLGFMNANEIVYSPSDRCSWTIRSECTSSNPGVASCQMVTTKVSPLTTIEGPYSSCIFQNGCRSSWVDINEGSHIVYIRVDDYPARFTGTMF
jgi:hypothetical protein